MPGEKYERVLGWLRTEAFGLELDYLFYSFLSDKEYKRDANTSEVKIHTFIRVSLNIISGRKNKII